VSKRGAKGAVSSTGVAVEARPSPGFVDAVGAGDSFNAGFLVGRLTGASDLDALRLAVAVGTLSTRGAGGTACQPDMAQARAWIAEGES
jgi:sugar/nucleoside kinase (ribokinase family)